MVFKIQITVKYVFEIQNTFRNGVEYKIQILIRISNICILIASQPCKQVLYSIDLLKQYPCIHCT